MDFLQPASLREALEMKAAHPDAVPIQGGTDVMVEINLDHRRPAALLDLNRVSELNEWGREDGLVRVGAGVTYTRILAEMPMLPGLAMASRTVGSPQIRNRARSAATWAPPHRPVTPTPRCWPATPSWRPSRCGAPGTSRSASSTPG